MSENKFLSLLKNEHKKYLTILHQNEDYVLAMPPPELITDLDENLILQHILQVHFGGKEMVSLTGQSYKIKNRKVKMVGDKDFKCKILSNDIAYADNN
jgi:hypothetical protein